MKLTDVTVYSSLMFTACQKIGDASVSFIEAIESGWAKCFQYSGRASRAEFWWFFLFATLVRFGLQFVRLLAQDVPTILLSAMISLIILVPTIAVQVRRLHDVGHSGWLVVVLWVLIGTLIITSMRWDRLVSLRQATTPDEVALLFVAFATAVAWLRLLFLMIKRGDAGANQYGPPVEPGVAFRS